MPVPGVPSGVLPLSAEAPGYLALDTSAVVHALLESQSRHKAYRGYLAGALGRGSRLVFSELLEVELAEACLRFAGNEQHATASAVLAARNDYLLTVMGGWEALLDEATYFRLPIRETHSAQGWEHAFALALNIVGGFAVRMPDAIHAATAAILSAPLHTDDLDFSKLPAHLLTIVTHDEQVDAARANRR
jgi:predicted nucleic acid-binding protein